MTIWLISDWHLGHDNCCVKFQKTCLTCGGGGDAHPPEMLGDMPSGKPCPACEGTGKVFLRPFRNAAECDDALIARHNALVKPPDHYYHLGDVCIHPEFLAKVKSFNGHGRLVRGNHDIFKTKQYIEAGFKEIHGCRVINNLMLTHVPIHPSCLGRFAGNVHGHIHAAPTPAGAYLNVGVEVLNYTPITLEDASHRLAAQHVDHDAVTEIELLSE